MDILHSLYDIVSGLGSFLLIPVFFFLLGLASRAGVQRSGQCAPAVLGSTVAIQLLPFPPGRPTCTGRKRPR